MVPMCLMFSITAGLKLKLYHIDIEIAFLHCDLDEEIYTEQPPYFVSSTIPHYVCKLHKSLYGLKQSSRMWHHKLHTYLEAIGFRCLQAETTLYVWKEHTNFFIIGIYVDDFPIASNSTKCMQLVYM